MKIKGFLLIAIFMSSSSYAMADIDFLAELGIHNGGDNLVTANFTDGSNATIKTGEFLALDLGIAWDMGIMEARVAGGWKYDSISAVDGGIDFSRFTHQFILLFKAGEWRFGGGYAYHFNVEVDGSGEASVADSEFDDALGWTAQANYYFTEDAYVGLVYTNIEYDRLATLGNSSQTFDASSIAFTIGGRW